MYKYPKTERRSKDRKPITNQFTIKLMREINKKGTVIIVNEPVKFKGHPNFNYVD